MRTWVIESDETMDYQRPSAAQAQYDTSGTQGHIGTKDLLDTHDYLSKIRQQQNDGLPYEKKLDLVMQRTSDAEKLARTAAQSVLGLKHEVTRGFEQIHSALQRIASGQPPQEEHPPGSSIFDP